MLTELDYIALGVFLLSAVALAYVGWQVLRSRRAGKVKFVKHPQDLEAVLRHLAVVYTSADFAGYKITVESSEESGRPLSKREVLRQKLHEALATDPTAPDDSPSGDGGDGDGDPHDYPSEEDIVAPEDAPPAAQDDSAEAAGESGEMLHPDPAADFFKNKKWEQTI
jgi:hypothetical protein